MWRRIILPGAFVLALFAVQFFRDPPDTAGRHLRAFTGSTMGTTWSAKVVTDAPLEESVASRLQGAIEAELEAVNAQMSTYRADSELSRFNRHDTTRFTASGPLREVVTEAQRISEASGGAFDVTVGPLVKAWGFGPDRHSTPPDPATIARLREQAGFRHLRVTGDALQKELPGLQIDLSAIAKGYAVDQVAELFEGHGYANYLVEVGGEVRGRGRNAEGKLWRIGVERPVDGSRTLQEVVALDAMGLATSGDYRNFYEKDGRRLSHTIDPRTGRPVEHALASVSVLHPSAATADAWATALNVLGPEAGFDAAQAQELAALFIIRTGPDAFETRATPQFEAVRSTTAADQPR